MDPLMMAAGCRIESAGSVQGRPSTSRARIGEVPASHTNIRLVPVLKVYKEYRGHSPSTTMKISLFLSFAVLSFANLVAGQTMEKGGDLGKFNSDCEANSGSYHCRRLRKRADAKGTKVFSIGNAIKSAANAAQLAAKKAVKASTDLKKAEKTSTDPKKTEKTPTDSKKTEKAPTFSKKASPADIA
ncbi:MAG: hypothetical protein SGCHY_003793, partial [Lobulomycetales sp.]